MKKVCTKCKVLKPLEGFNKRAVAKDGHSSQCKECNKENLRKDYLKSKSKYRERNKRSKLRRRAWFIEFKKTLSCIKCGESRWWVLDFHHRNPENKEGDLGNLLNHSKKAFEKELEKCDVLCANCHRDEHYKLNNS
jgi:hypothetical protein